MSDPDAEPTREQVDEWHALVRASQPPDEPGVIWDEGEPEPAPTANERAWDRWYVTPVADSLVAKVAPMIHAPRRFEDRAPRARRRVRRARARSPGRPADDPDPLDGSGAAA